MAAGLHGEGGNPGFVNFQPSVKLQAVRMDRTLSQDMMALRTPLWTDPGGGYSYASNSPHVASIVLRHIVGMEMQQYLDEKVAKPMGFGNVGLRDETRNGTMEHTPGGGNIALRSTDIVRAGYMLLHHGMWNDQQIVPADYVEACGKPQQVSEACAVQPDVRGERRRPRGWRTSRRIFQIRRRRLRHLRHSDRWIW